MKSSIPPKAIEIAKKWNTEILPADAFIPPLVISETYGIVDVQTRVLLNRRGLPEDSHWHRLVTAYEKGATRNAIVNFVAFAFNTPVQGVSDDPGLTEREQEIHEKKAMGIANFAGKLNSLNEVMEMIQDNRLPDARDIRQGYLALKAWKKMLKNELIVQQDTQEQFNAKGYHVSPEKIQFLETKISALEDSDDPVDKILKSALEAQVRKESEFLRNPQAHAAFCQKGFERTTRKIEAIHIGLAMADDLIGLTQEVAKEMDIRLPENKGRGGRGGK